MVFADVNVEAIGYGTTAANGVYDYDSDVNGKPQYINATYKVCWTGTLWLMTPTGDPCAGGAGVIYYDNDAQDVVEPYDVTTWEIGAGDSPAGEFFPYTPPDPPATTTATTTTIIMDPNRDYFTGWIAFVVFFFGTIWLFRKR